jgi:copper chaperone CopZ
MAAVSTRGRASDGRTVTLKIVGMTCASCVGRVEKALARVPGVTEELADQIARIVRSLRTLELKKYPSVSETLDWARTLVVLGREEIGNEDAVATLHILLKYQSDIERATKELRAGPRTVA